MKVKAETNSRLKIPGISLIVDTQSVVTQLSSLFRLCFLLLIFSACRNLDIRDALLQMLKVMRDNNKKAQQESFEIKQQVNEVAKGLKTITGSGGVEKKIDNISTFLLRMNNKIEALSRGSGGGRTAILETLAQESYDIISLLPTYIDNTRKAVYNVGNDTKTMLKGVESILSDEDDVGGQMSLRKAIQTTEEHILSSSNELRDIIVESGSMAESLFDRVDSGYKELEEEIKGLSNVEKVLLDTADAVMDTKRKIEFGVQQIIFKVSDGALHSTPSLTF